MMIFDPPLSKINVETGVFHTPSGRPLILVVDDYPANITMLYEILERDCEVCMATSGQAALAFCEGRRPDLILLDIMMPEMDGYEVCRHLKDNDLTRDIPIIFVTTKSDPSEETRGLDLGAVDFISKPFHTKIVRARVRTHLTLQLQAEALRSLAMIDGLTGIANRRQFDTILSAEWHRCIRSHSAMSLVLIDIDFFKRYNDYYGHQAGDECIRTIAATLKKNLRRSHDMVARYGGEEFACILPDTQREGACSKAAELEMAVRALGIPHERSDVEWVVTISLGVATATPEKGDDPASLVTESDLQLYAAKQSGRAQVHASLVK